MWSGEEAPRAAPQTDISSGDAGDARRIRLDLALQSLIFTKKLSSVLLMVTCPACLHANAGQSYLQMGQFGENQEETGTS